MHIAQNEIELALVILGFGLGVSTRLKFAFRLTIFMLQVIEWWMKTHPTGQRMAYETNLDDEFYRLFGVELKEHSHLFDGHTEKEMSTALDTHRLLTIGEAAKVVNRKVGTLRLWDTVGKLKPAQIGKNGMRRYRMSDLEQFAKRT